MKRFTILVLAMLLFIITPVTAWAEDRIVTIYFAGTGADVLWHLPVETSWSNHPELLATLYEEHQISSTHYKWFVDGIGSGCSHLGFFGNLGDLVGSGFPGWDICRGWQTNLDEATVVLESIMSYYPDDEIILNLIGWSRGGILTMRFAYEQSANSQLKRINILAIDPVVGDLDEMWNVGHYVLGSKVAHYVGLYSQHERSYMFSPTLPKYDSSNTDAWMLRVPGSHETLVGNLQVTGHSIITACRAFGPDCTGMPIPPVSWFTGDNSIFDDDLENVYWVSKVLAQKLLGTPEWGEVNFDWDWYAGAGVNQSRRELFNAKLNAMWNYPASDYQYMQNFAFTPGGLENVDGLFGVPACGIPLANGQQADRCTINYSSGAVNINTGLLANTSPLSMVHWSLLNQPPVADAGGPYAQECTRSNGADVLMDGSASYDPDGTIEVYDWMVDGMSATGVMPTFSLPLGIHNVSLTVEDDEGATDIDRTTATVSDTEPPAILSISATPSLLWPPNGKMTQVEISVLATDSCDTAPVCSIASILSSEPDDDGDDSVITGRFTTQLRAERLGTGAGRVYTILVECTDASDNSTTGTMIVTVPHDQSKKAKLE